MGFPTKLLADNEEVVMELRPHWITLAGPVLWTVLLLVASAIAGGLLSGTARLAVAGLAAAAWIFVALVPLARWYFTLFVLTSDRLITRKGVLAKHSKEIPLERINDVAFSQTVLERMVGAGDLLVESAGERGQERIDNVRKPEQIQLLIYRTSEANNTRIARPEQISEPPSVPDQIEALARLRDRGVLTEDEFRSKKQDLLRRM